MNSNDEKRNGSYLKTINNQNEKMINDNFHNEQKKIKENYKLVC